MLWIYFPEISWLWWNAIGCLVAFGVGYSVSMIFKRKTPCHLIKHLIFDKNQKVFFQYKKNWRVYYGILAGYFLFIILVCYMIQRLAAAPG